MGELYELKDKSCCPPGGFVFRRKDGLKYEGTYGPQVVEECRRHLGLDEKDAWQRVLHETYTNIIPSSRDYFITKATESLVCQNPTFRYVPSNSLLPAPFHYNCGLINFDGDDWLVYRRQLANSDSTACRFNFRTHENFTINLPENVQGEQFEDPRVFEHDSAVHIIVSSWRKNWVYKPSLRLFRLNPDWTVNKEILLTHGGNGKGVTQKNWQYFSHESELHFVYLCAPFQVVKDGMVYTSIPLKWKYGEIRGGTPPVRVGDEYFTFFHSRLDHGRSCYYMGCVSFSANAPFKPTRMTMEPLMTATNKEPNLHWAPLCLFPCGAIFREGKWIVSLGVNDLACALADWEHSDLSNLMTPV